MSNEKVGCAIFAIVAVILAMSTLNVFNKDNFTEVNPNQNVVPRYSTGPNINTTQNLENYQNRLVMNTGTSVESVNKAGAR